MFSQHGEEWIDDELRNVAIPSDLITKLHAITSMDDSELDRALCDVAVPAGVLERLRSIGTLDEVDLDDELKHVLVPISVMDRLRRIPATVGRVGRRRIPRQFAIAASLLVAAGVGYVIAISSSWFDALNKRPNQGNAVAGAAAPSLPNDAITNAKVGKSNVSDSLANHPPLEAPKPSDFQFGPPDVDRPELSSSVVSKIAAPSAADSKANGEEAGSAHVVLGAPVADNASSNGSSVAGDGAPSGTASATNFPPLQSMPPPVWRGISPPRERGYDLMFQLKHGVHPLVSPAASPALAVSQVPLVTSTASFDQACQLAAERKLPPAYKIRTEEFLAAMDYGFALPDDRSVAIRTALGPAPWGTPGASLLQVAAQAGKVRAENRPEITESKSQLVASDATMKVTFNPDAVSMYRLMGHEATSVAGLMSTTVEANLRSGEAATGLFELSLKPDGGETIATVEIKWRNPATGAMQTTRQTVSRLQLSPSFYQAPLSLQMAALAAETAEVLRGSPFAPPNTHSLGNVAELAGQLNPRLRNRPSFAKLMTLVDQAQRSHIVAQ